MFDGITDAVTGFTAVLTAMVIAGIAAAVYLRYVRKARPDGEEGDYRRFPVLDSAEFVDVGDIRDDMIIDASGRRFTAVLTCSGCDFYSMDTEEQIMVQNGYISFIRQFRTDVCFLQVPESVNLSYKIRQYDEMYARRRQELFFLKQQSDELIGACADMRARGEDVPGEAAARIRELREQMEALDWRCFHIEDQRQLAELMSGRGSDVERMNRMILFSWEDGGGVSGTPQSGEALLKRASEELGKLSSQMTRSLQGARVNARRMTTAELVGQFRKQTHPLTGGLATVEEIGREMVSDGRPVTTDSFDRKIDDYIGEAAEDSIYRML